MWGEIGGLFVGRFYDTIKATAGYAWRRKLPSGERIAGFFLLLLLALTACDGTPPGPPPQPPSPLAFFPIYIQPPTDPLTVCLDYNPQAVAFYRLMTGDTRQERPMLACHPALVRAAQRRAASLIAGGYWAHCDPNGICANQVARNMGCALPASYGAGNNIESLVAGSDDAGVMFAALAASPSHAPHLFGRGWFRHQRHAGIAVMPGGRFGRYWVILVGVCESSSGE